MTLADIADGNTATADVFFLIAAILFGLAAIVYLIPPTNPPRPYAGWAGFLVAAGLCLVSIAWLVL